MEVPLRSYLLQRSFQLSLMTLWVNATCFEILWTLLDLTCYIFLRTFFFGGKTSCIPSYLEIHFVARDDCELLLLLPPTSQMLRLQMCTNIPGIDSAETSSELGQYSTNQVRYATLTVKDFCICVHGTLIYRLPAILLSGFTAVMYLRM